MENLKTLCSDARESGRTLLSVYLTAGFPRLDWNAELARAIFDAGADFIELGIPFSDPIADGPVIQRASTVALASGLRMSDVFTLCETISRRGPVVFMGYYNSIANRGLDSFLSSARQAGGSALIVPDLLQGTEREFWDSAASAGLPLIPFTAPTSTNERMSALDESGAPFVYAVSLTGVTGARAQITPEVGDYLSRVRQHVHLPVMVGFGVSGPESAKTLASYCDGVIVGSAVIRRIEEASDKSDAIRKVSAFVRELKQAIS